MRRRSLCRLALAAAMMFTCAPSALAAPTAAQYATCAKACLGCLRACVACNKHCRAMGKGQHLKTLALSADCADVCEAAARICERHGPMTAAICAACEQACNACGAECKQSPGMAPMAVCARSCALCAQACRDMVAALH